jgi:iron complex transport system ATP-binding protein
VLTGRYAALEPWWHHYRPEDHERAARLLDEAGLGGAGDREFGLLSEGERQKLLLARALMGDPELLLLDEPAAGLDLGAREQLVARLAELAADAGTPPLVLVTHHVEEIPPGTTHAALLRGGRMLASGAVSRVLTSDEVSRCFELAVEVERSAGRWSARAEHGPAGRALGQGDDR